MAIVSLENKSVYSSWFSKLYVYNTIISKQDR